MQGALGTRVQGTAQGPGSRGSRGHLTLFGHMRIVGLFSAKRLSHSSIEFLFLNPKFLSRTAQFQRDSLSATSNWVRIELVKVHRSALSLSLSVEYFLGNDKVNIAFACH